MDVGGGNFNIGKFFILTVLDGLSLIAMLSVVTDFVGSLFTYARPRLVYAR